MYQKDSMSLLVKVKSLLSNSAVKNSQLPPSSNEKKRRKTKLSEEHEFIDAKIF